MGIRFYAKKALNGFTLDAGWEIGNELCVIFGYSGSGKSMTLQMISGIIRPDAGSIRISGKTLFDAEAGLDLPPQKRALGYVFQDLALFPHMTVAGNLAYAAASLSRRERDERGRDLIRMFRLQGLEDRYPSQLSGGQKQRVAFARALMGRPSALLLDEPFSALDAPVRAEMRLFLKEIREAFDIPVVLITHDLAEACELADRMIVYADGRAVQSGSPREILLRPAGSDVEQLVGCVSDSLHAAQPCPA